MKRTLELFPYEQVTDFADRMPEGFVMRPLQISDYEKGYASVLFVVYLQSFF